MPPVGLEPTISAGERPYTYALDRASTGSDQEAELVMLIWKERNSCVFISPSSNLEDENFEF